MTRLDLPARGGIYVLSLELLQPHSVVIGRLGAYQLTAGSFLYVGSAHGPGGLRGRLAHHLRPATHPHWHIDYLRAVAPLRSIWWAEAPAAAEHEAAAALARLQGATLAIPRFGAGDCCCPAHLVHMPRAIALHEASRHLPAAAWHALPLPAHNEAAPVVDAAPPLL